MTNKDSMEMTKMSGLFYCVWTLARIITVFKRKASLILSMIAVAVFIMKWRFLCTDLDSSMQVSRVCASFKNGQSMGNLCDSLCKSKDSTPLTCQSFSTEKAAVFYGVWMNNSAVFKSTQPVLNNGLTSKLETYKNDNSLENDFILMIRLFIKTKLNLSINEIDAKRMSYIQYSQPGGNRYTEMRNVWSLILDKEYLALTLYEKFEVFPKLFGTCGDMYAVEKLDPISGYWRIMTLFDNQKEWKKRVKISLMILEFLIHLEDDLPEPMFICNVKINEFGITNDFKKVKYSNLNSVHPLSIVNDKTANDAHCKKHSDCDLGDCRSFCNLVTSKCENGVANNNLQIVCEKIFLGWMMSGRIMVPGLLFGPNAPAVLIEELEKCANPSNEYGTARSPATKETRNRLYKLLTHLAM